MKYWFQDPVPPYLFHMVMHTSCCPFATSHGGYMKTDWFGITNRNKVLEWWEYMCLLYTWPEAIKGSRVEDEDSQILTSFLQGTKRSRREKQCNKLRRWASGGWRHPRRRVPSLSIAHYTPLRYKVHLMRGSYNRRICDNNQTKNKTMLRWWADNKYSYYYSIQWNCSGFFFSLRTLSFSAINSSYDKKRKLFP